MIINEDGMKPEEVNSYYHKVRAAVLDKEGKLYLASMDGTYTLPGGGVEESETIDFAMIRELKEELGINVSLEELSYLGNYQFYHKNFPDFQGRTNRLNEIDLFLVTAKEEFKRNETSFTELEKQQGLRIISINIDEIEGLLAIENDNPFKKSLDEELRFLLEIVKERKKNVR